MNDLFGHTEPQSVFKDIRNQRDVVAEEKARLCKKRNEIMRIVPPSVRDGSVQAVRAWQHHHKAALKILQSKRSSVTDLRTALNNMESYK